MPEKHEIADNYEIIEQIAETHKSIVYRAKDKTNQQIVILKSFKKKYPSFWELAQIRQENKLVQSLEYPGVVKSLGLIWKDDSIFISFEDTKGESLKNCIQKNFISMSSFLDLGIRLADTLAFIHSKGIIHKDIKPHNIIVRYVDNEFKDVRLTDFGLSVIQNDDIQSFYNPKAIEGTLPYISPEQSGRMNLSIDYRTDFYSLGITLYEVLAGELPFASNDPIELIHSHIARTPPPIQDKQKRDIPEAVAGIIYKLLAKSPEDRYQNAGSLKKEFEYCKEHYNKKGTINHFKPGMMDVADRFIIPQKIIGRDVEIQSLLNVFDKVQNGSREVMLVSGSPGIGKSRLIYEVQKPILKARGYFFSGKYDKMRKDVPFSSLIQSFQALIKQILTESEERIFVWKKKILENINQNGKIIIQVIPELEYIIGEQPDVPDVSTEESHNRFNYTFLKFIKVFATKEHPLTLFLDDIQWADLASIHLLQEIILDSELKYFFLICAYRLEEVSEFHPFHKMIQNISKKDVQVNKIFLNPLNSEYVYGFLAHLMGEKSAKIQEVAELLYSKTHGNPFFLTQFIKNLYDEKIIHYDNIESIWFCDIEKIRELNVTENVIDLMVNRINSLPEESKNLLKMAACIGNRFSLELLSALYGKNYEETLEVLDPLLREGFVVSNGDLYRFLHDRIQEASYSLVKPEEKIGIHTLIGYITLTDLKDGELNEKIFYITDQLNHGRTQIYFESEKENLAQFNLDAGVKAAFNGAYEPAYSYLQIGTEILNSFKEDPWKINYKLSLDLYSRLAEVCYLCTRYEKLSEIEKIIESKAVSNDDKLRMYEIIIKTYMARNELKKAVEKGLFVLETLGIRFPKNLNMFNTGIQLLKFKFQVAFKDIESFRSLPRLEDQRIESGFRIISTINSAAYWERPQLLPFLIIRVASLSIKHGLSIHTPYNFAGIGLIYASLGDYLGAKKFGDIAVQLIDRWGLQSQSPKVNFVNNTFVRPWHESLRDVLDDLENNFQKAVEIGDIEFASHAGFVCSYFSYLAGVELENLISLIGKFYEAAKKFQQHTDLNVLKLYYQIVCNLTERSPNSFELKGDHYDIDQFLPIHISANDRTALFHVYLNGLIMNYLYDRLEIAYDYALKVRSALDGGIAVIAMAVFYFYEGLVCIRLFRKSFENLKQYWKKFIYNRKKIQKLVKFAKQNFEHKFYLLDAEYWREKNHFGKAISCYEKSIKLARASNYLQEEGISNQLAADFLIANGYKDLAKLYINNSRNNFLNWGATGIARQIASNYSEYMYAKRGIQEDYTSNSLHSTNITPNLDLNTILKFSHILSREIELKSLLDKILTLSIKSAGAEKGILILETKGKLFIEAVYRGPGELDLLGSRPIEESSEIPQQIINYVSKTKENVILSNAAYSDQFSNDKYLSENNIKSVLCSPILYKGKMSGILYLENNLASSAFTEERLELLAVLSSQAAISIENARLLSNREDSARLQKEMEITSAIQRSLIPLEPVSKGYTMSGFMKPAMAVGGDYYDVINSIEKDWVVIGDVSGHGILSGLIMMMVQTSIRLIVSKEPSIKPSQLLKSIILGIDENIHKISKYQYKYMTITVLSYDSDGNFSHCGQHQDLLIYRKKTNQIEYIPTEGVWIGMANLLTDAGITLSDKQFKLFPGDLLLLFTDGITEGVNKQGEMLGTQGLANILKENADLPMGQIKDKILESIEGYSTPDDITFLCIRKD